MNFLAVVGHSLGRLVPIGRWQDTDYRDFRANFLQFMRQPTLTDDPEMIPLDAMSETGAPTAEECPGEVMQNSSLQQVIVGAVMYKGTTEIETEGAPEATAAEVATRTTRATSSMGECLNPEGGRHVRAWAVDPGEDGNEADGEGGVRVAVAAAAAKAKVQADGVQAPESRAVPGSGVPDSLNAALAESGGAEDAPAICNDYMVGEGEEEFCAGGSSESWEDGDHLSSASAFGGWGPFGGEDGGGDGGDGGVMKVRRSFSNLETARRNGAGFVGEVAGDGAESQDGEGGGGRRPRALSLDGWFTCNLANSKMKSYATHDHTSRLREVLQLVSITQ